MSETEMGGKWTPGPWKYTASTPADGYEFFEIIQASRYVGTVNGPQNDEGTANARPIAESPALADALEKIRHLAATSASYFRQPETKDSYWEIQWSKVVENRTQRSSSQRGSEEMDGSNPWPTTATFEARRLRNMAEAGHRLARGPIPASLW